MYSSFNCYVFAAILLFLNNGWAQKAKQNICKTILQSKGLATDPIVDLERARGPRQLLSQIEFSIQLKRAVRFASVTHKRVNNLYNGLPYTVHLGIVFKVLQEFGVSSKTEWGQLLLISVWLHDSVEDVGFIDKNDIERLFGGDIAQLVDSVTKVPKENFVSDLARKQATADKLKLHSLGVILKLADKLGNMRWAIANNDFYPKHRDDILVYFTSHVPPHYFSNMSVAGPLKTLEYQLWLEIFRSLPGQVLPVSLEWNP